MNLQFRIPGDFLTPLVKHSPFFSHVHHTFTRIDYFLVDNRFHHSVCSCSFEPIVTSDHSPVIVSIHFKGMVCAQTPCRLNTRLLSDKDFVEYVSNQIDIFLSINKTPDISASILRETLKAYIRVQIISFVGNERRKKRERLEELTRHITHLDSLYATLPILDLYKERLSAQSEFNTLSTDQAVELLLKSKCIYYEQGDSGHVISPPTTAVCLFPPNPAN